MWRGGAGCLWGGVWDTKVAPFVGKLYKKIMSVTKSHNQTHTKRDKPTIVGDCEISPLNTLVLHSGFNTFKARECAQISCHNASTKNTYMVLLHPPCKKRVDYQAPQNGLPFQNQALTGYQSILNHRKEMAENPVIVARNCTISVNFDETPPKVK